MGGVQVNPGRLTSHSVLLTAAVAAALICVLVSSPVLASVPRGFDLVAENDYLILYVNTETAEIAVTDKRSEQTWYSNPPDRDSSEKIARGDAKLALGAQFRLTYFEPGDTMRTVNSYLSSVAYNQFEVTPIEGGVRVDYLVGKKWNERDFLPIFLEKDVFENDIMGKITDRRTQRTLEGSYILLILEESTGEGAQIAGYSIKAPGENLRDRDQRMLTEVIIDHIVSNSSKIRDRNDIKASTLEPFIGTEFYMLRQRERDLLAWDLEDIVAAMREIELDPAEISEYYVRLGLDPREPNVVLFSVSMEYTLDHDNLVVRIPASEIRYPKDVLDTDGQKVTYPLVSIDVLPYFGAAGIGDEGYMLVPDGSGGLIYLNSGKTNMPTYASRIYGRDNSLSPPPSTMETRQSCFPVYGLKSGERAFFAIIEDGDALAQITADISGKRESYNTIYPQFRLLGYATTSLQGEVDATHRESAQWVIARDTINVYQSEMYEGDIKIRYAFLNGEDANYPGMARYYRSYLEARERISRLPATDSIPIFVELIGAVSDVRPVLGVPREVVVPLTTYKQAKDIAAALIDKGITNIHMAYTGWMKHGVNHSYPTKVRLERALGERSDLAALREYLAGVGGELYPTVDFVMVHRTDLLSGFLVFRDASRYLNRTAVHYQIESGQRANIADRNPTYVYILSPSRLDGLVTRYLKDYVKYGFTAMALGDLAFQLHSDFRHGRSINRQTTLDIVEAQIAKAREDYSLRLLANGLNAYALPYVSGVINLPMFNGGQDLVDESVPFVHIVLHGYVDYAGDPANFAYDRHYHLLKSLETGSLPYFVGYFADPSVLKGSDFDYLYTGKYDRWLDEAIAFYTTVQPIFSKVYNQRIVDHRRLEDEVYETCYENGVRVVVNYGSSSVTVDGHEIGPTDFMVFEGEREI